MIGIAPFVLSRIYLTTSVDLFLRGSPLSPPASILFTSPVAVFKPLRLMVVFVATIPSSPVFFYYFNDVVQFFVFKVRGYF